MTELGRMDRYFVWHARNVERRALQYVSSQKALRLLFAATAPLMGRVPPTVTPLRDDRGWVWFRPAGVARDAPVILYIPGGGFTIGSPRTHRALVGHLAQAAGLRAVAIPYRLAPEHSFPAARDDCIAAYRHLLDAGERVVAICGDSAGGCLTLQVAQHARDANWPLPQALGLIAPVADLSGDIAARFAQAPDEILIPSDWPRRIQPAYLPHHDPASAEVSPLLGNLRGLPPTMIQFAEEEALAQDAHRLANAMDTVTCDPWRGLPHVWHLHAGLSPAANAALARLGQFLNRQDKT